MTQTKQLHAMISSEKKITIYLGSIILNFPPWEPFLFVISVSVKLSLSKFPHTPTNHGPLISCIISQQILTIMFGNQRVTCFDGLTVCCTDEISNSLFHSPLPVLLLVISMMSKF